MEPTNEAGEGAGSTSAGGGTSAEAGLLHQAMSLWSDVRGLLHDHLTLAALEAQLAGRSLVAMIAAGVMVAALLVSAWLGIMGAGALWLISIGVAASVAILLVVVANLAFALILCVVIVRQSRYLLFSRTLRSFGSGQAELQGTEKS